MNITQQEVLDFLKTETEKVITEFGETTSMLSLAAYGERFTVSAYEKSPDCAFGEHRYGSGLTIELALEAFREAIGTPEIKAKRNRDKAAQLLEEAERLSPSK